MLERVIKEFQGFDICFENIELRKWIKKFIQVE